MKIELKTMDNDDYALIIRSETSSEEDVIVKDWYYQILNHLKKLKLK